MPTFNFTSPEGKQITVEGPEGATVEQALERAKGMVKEPAAGKVPSTDIGTGGAFMEGVTDPLVGGKQLFKHITGSPKEIEATDAEVVAREDALKKRGIGEHPIARGVGRAVPGVATALPVGGVGGAILGGAVGGMLEPETDTSDYWTKKAYGAGVGGLTGGGPGALMKGTGKALSPNLDEAKKLLMKAGVDLTPGQLSGPLTKFVENYGLKNVPLMGYIVRGAEKRGGDQFQIGAMNEALKPLGVKMPDKVKAGHEANTVFDEVLDKAYSRVLDDPSLRLSYTGQLDDGIKRVLANSAIMPKAQQDQLKAVSNIIIKRAWNKEGDLGENLMQFIDGRRMKDIETKLGQEAREYKYSSDPDQRKYGAAVEELRSTLREALAIQNPKAANDLGVVNDTFHVAAMVQSAARRRAGSEGKFSPQDLLQVIRDTDLTARDRLFREGRMPLQPYAEAGKKIMGSELPNSGTTEQAMMQVGLRDLVGSATAGGVAHALGAAVPVAAGLGAGSAVYSKPAMRGLNKVVGRNVTRPEKAAGDFLKKYSGAGGAGVSPIIEQLNNE